MMTNIARVAIYTACGICFMSLSASADVIELKTGQRIEGVFKRAVSGKVSLEVDGQTITFPQGKVRAIYLGSAQNLPNQTSLRSNALDALMGLESAIEGGISYRDYAPRVTDAKIIVDRYLDEDKSDPAVAKSDISAAMKYFVLASNAWSESISIDAGIGQLALDPLVAECPTAQAAIEKGRANGSQMIGIDQASSDGVALAVSFSSFWPCAKKKIADAEVAFHSN